MEINEYKLPPIHIAMVAPSGAGKTSLLSTVYEYIKDAFNRDNSFSIKPCNQNDKLILNKFNQEVKNKLMAGSLKFKSGLNATQSSKKFEFELSFEKNAQRVSQIISVMDIPGGWITDPDSHKDFVEHLKQSHFLWIPVEAPVLMKARTSQERGLSSDKLQTTFIQKLVDEWTKSCAEADRPANICFILSKCETYFSQDKTGMEAGKCKERFDENFKTIVQSVHDNYPNAQIHYVPVETIGPIKLIVSDWEKDVNDKWYLDTQYKITNKDRKIAGAKYLMDGVLEFASKQIDALLGQLKDDKEQERKVKEEESDPRNPFKWIWNFVSGKMSDAEIELKEIEAYLVELEELRNKFDSLRPTIDDKEKNDYFQNL
ncbi:MAG: hypothetical protein J6T70_19075 [Bacteroidales bacterium]|nr:hypothetical protein [Bacteroidales bacterium]